MFAKSVRVRGMYVNVCVCDISPRAGRRQGVKRVGSSLSLTPHVRERTFICERGVIMYNLVDILIYKQSLMKFLLFINNTLSPLENVSYGAGGLIVRNSHLWK